MHAGYAFAEFYLSLIAYFVLHMIFVISSDFVEAFNIPPLNIGIYVDKLAAIRALLMVIADIFEWGITQKACGDPGSNALSSDDAKTDKKKMARRLGSLLSFLAMLICRLAYIIIVYKSDNKSLSVFVTLCLEGFWFGVFQMSFFAVGPEFNAITSLGIHTMGNFIFFLQVILQREAKSKPKINSLYRVRVHAWIVVVTSFIALGLWIWFCYEYSYGGGDSDQFQALVCVLKETQVDQNANADTIATKLAEKMRDAKVTALNSASEKEANDLKNRLKESLIEKDKEGLKEDEKKYSKALGGSGNGSENVAKLLVKAEFGYDFSGTLTGTLGGQGNNVEVQIGKNATEERGKATVTVKKEEVSADSSELTIKVMNDDGSVSRSVGRRIARKLAKALTQVKSVKDSGNSTIEINANINHFGESNVWSPFLLFIIGAFAEDFSVPGVLPFAFLDPEKANLVNYLTPLFFMTGAFVVFLVDSVFSSEQSLFGKIMKSLDSEFKGWSEGAVHEWHAVWLLNIPKYIAFFIAMWSIHGTFARLRCIIQSRWRVLLLTMIVVVPRATLEVMGYVGVANYAIAASETGDWDGFTYIALHDMLAMFCRFVYVKFAVGYK